MRKLFAAVFTLCIVAVMGPASFAGVGVSTMTASVVFTSTTGVVSMNAVIMNMSGGTTTQIWWDPSSVIVNTSGWVGASAYILLYSTITSSTGGIEIYTDNTSSITAPIADPLYTGAISTWTVQLGNPAGLVSAKLPKFMFPMCWRVSATPLTSLNIVQIIPSNQAVYAELYDANSPAPANQFYCYLWVEDKALFNFPTNLDYRTIRDSRRGIQYCETTWGQAVSPVYLYFGANFGNGTSLPDTFRTTTLTIEAFSE